MILNLFSSWQKRMKICGSISHSILPTKIIWQNGWIWLLQIKMRVPGDHLRSSTKRKIRLPAAAAWAILLIMIFDWKLAGAGWEKISGDQISIAMQNFQ